MSLELPHRDGSNKITQFLISWRNEKNIEFFTYEKKNILSEAGYSQVFYLLQIHTYIPVDVGYCLCEGLTLKVP